ncbi:MAG: agmatine deiminase family protein [Candidatus Neomarinimicrobiota bacterium]
MLSAVYFLIQHNTTYSSISNPYFILSMRITIYLILLFNLAIANGSSVELPIGLTDDEIARWGEIHLMGRDTDPPPSPVRNIAEYERMQGVLIRYPFGISTDIISEISQDLIVYCLVSSNQQNNANSILENSGVNMENIDFVIGPTDSYWTRDYGPWWIVDGNSNISIADFTYNRPRQNDNEAPLKMSNHLGVPYYATDLIHAGGNYMTDGLGIAASSDLVYEENLISENDVDSLMQAYYGIDIYHVVEDPNNTYIDHIDCWGKYLSPTKVLIREVPETHPQYDEIEEVASYFSSAMNAWGEPWQLYRVWTPNNQPYTNSLIINEKILVPIMGGSWDDEAIAAYENAMPGYEILGFTGSWESTDALHCRIKGIPDLEMLQIFHNPLDNGTEPVNNEYLLDIVVDDLSGMGTISDSVKVFWRELGSEQWESRQLYPSDIPENMNRWLGGIPALVDIGIIQYYIQAADYSGRMEKSPLAGWYSFLASPTDACSSWTVGDMDNSGELNVIDLLLLSDITHDLDIGICSQSISDINSDGETSLLDIQFLINILMNS